MNAKRNAWKPAGDVVAHCGEPVRNDADFFAPPPQEIGRVTTADSTLNCPDRPRSAALARVRTRVRMAIVFLVVSLLVAAPFLSTMPSGKSADASEVLVILCIAFLVGGMAAWFVSKLMARARRKRMPSCSYVGENGLAVYRLKGCAEDGAELEVLLFGDAEDLLTKETRHFVNGVYQGTQYQYDWRDSAGEGLMTIKGSYNEKSKKFKLCDQYFVAMSAERQWCDHRFDRMEAEFKRAGHVDFTVDAKRAVRIGPGYVEFLWPDGDHRVDVEDFGDVSLAEGLFRFKHRDAAWLGRKGKFNFQYGALPNAKLFLVALEQLAGIYFSGNEEPAPDDADPE